MTTTGGAGARCVTDAATGCPDADPTQLGRKFSPVPKRDVPEAVLGRWETRLLRGLPGGTRESAGSRPPASPESRGLGSQSAGRDGLGQLAKRAHQRRGKPHRGVKPLRRARLRRRDAETSASLDRWPLFSLRPRSSPQKGSLISRAQRWRRVRRDRRSPAISGRSSPRHTRTCWTSWARGSRRTDPSGRPPPGSWRGRPECRPHAAGFFMNGRMTMTSGANTRDGSSALNDVLVMPGWSAVAVTPVPCSRRASS